MKFDNEFAGFVKTVRKTPKEGKRMDQGNKHRQARRTKMKNRWSEE